MSEFLVWIVIGIIIFAKLFCDSYILPSNLKIRLYELGYNTGQQEAILSGLYKQN